MKKEKSINLMTDWIRLTVLFVCMCFLLPVGAQTGKGKTITYKCSNEKLQKALMTVERQSGYYRLQYAMEDVAPYTVTANIKNASAEDAVKQLLRNTNLQYEMNGRFIQVYAKKQSMSGRTRTVKGYVRDDNGEPLVGVPVCIGEGRVCTITDAEGFYTFPIPVEQTVLKYTYVGMETAYASIPQGTKEVTRDVVMRSDSRLDEVIVTGYQDIQKPKMTGAVTTINADKLENRYTSNLISNLEGRIAGLSTYGGEIKIRGTASLYAETAPLLVVDGLPTEGKIEDINQFDIQSINVLKDAAAAAIYGARAANGVIVITTKNANKSGKIDIDFTANLTISGLKNVDYNDNFYMDAAQQLKKESEYYDYNYFSGEVSDPIGEFESLLKTGQRPISALAYGYYQYANGEITQSELERLKSQLAQNNYAKDFADAIYKCQTIQEYNLSLRSRSEKNMNSLTLNYSNDNTGLINAFNRRFSSNYKGTFELAKWMSARMNINAIYSRNREKGYDSNSGNDNPWYRPAYESFYNGEGKVSNQYGGNEGSQFYQWQEGIADTGTNPIKERYDNVLNTKRIHLRFHGDLLFRLFAGLTLNTQFVYEIDNQNSEWLATADSHPARIIKNVYAVNNNGKISYPIMETGGFKQNKSIIGDYWTARGQINYSNTFGKHAVSAIAGLEFRQTKTKGSNALYTGYDDQLQTSTTSTIDFNMLNSLDRSLYFMDGTFPARSYVFMKYLQSGMDPVVEVMHRYGSGYANATYTYDDKYNIFASFRKDYADLYGLNVKYRGKPLWSVGGAWNIDQENFLNDIKWINVLKLRMSYGSTGNIYQGATSYLTASTGKINRYSLLPIATIESPANPELSWEKTNTMNIGIDFSLWNNRIRGSMDYYLKKSSDVFADKSIDPTTGFSKMFVNAANVENKGLELQLTGEWIRPLSRKQLGWTTSFTLSSNKNKVTNVDTPAKTAMDLVTTPFKEGYPTSAIWGFRFAGIDDGDYGRPGQPLWYGDVEGNEKTDDPRSKTPDILKYYGQSEPKNIIGLDNRLEWNGFSLSFMMAYYSGHVMRALPESVVFGGNYSTLPLYLLNSWTPEKKTDIVGYGQYATFRTDTPDYSSNAIYKADFLKIRNIVFAYNAPRQWFSSLGINRMNLQFQINNPGFLWRANKKNIDPETLGVSMPTSYVFTLHVNI